MYLKTFAPFFRGGEELTLLDIWHLLKYGMLFILFITESFVFIYFSKWSIKDLNNELQLSLSSHLISSNIFCL